MVVGDDLYALFLTPAGSRVLPIEGGVAGLAGDVAVLPAGTGHQRISSTPDLLVIGAYPPDGHYDLCRGTSAEHARALETIPRVPLPQTDPLFGADGPLTKLWRP